MLGTVFIIVALMGTPGGLKAAALSEPVKTMEECEIVRKAADKEMEARAAMLGKESPVLFSMCVVMGEST